MQQCPPLSHGRLWHAVGLLTAQQTAKNTSMPHCTMSVPIQAAVRPAAVAAVGFCWIYGARHTWEPAPAPTGPALQHAVHMYRTTRCPWAVLTHVLQEHMPVTSTGGCTHTAVTHTPEREVCGSILTLATSAQNQAKNRRFEQGTAASEGATNVTHTSLGHTYALTHGTCPNSTPHAPKSMKTSE